MALRLDLPKNSFNLPWFMFDLANKQLITSPFIPTDISDSKDVVLAENPVPGLNFQPVYTGGGGNRKVSFNLMLIKRNNSVGNVFLLKQFDNLRNQSGGLLSLFSSGQFRPNPQVLFYWGTGSLPLVWFVKKCDAVHKEGWVNQIGMPQYSEIQFELLLDETHPLYKAEEVWRKVGSIAGQIVSLADLFGKGSGRRY